MFISSTSFGTYGTALLKAQLGLQVSHTIYYKGDTGPFLEVPADGNGDPFFPREKTVGTVGPHVGAKPTKQPTTTMCSTFIIIHTWVMGLTVDRVAHFRTKPLIGKVFELLVGRLWIWMCLEHNQGQQKLRLPVIQCGQNFVHDEALESSDLPASEVKFLAACGNCSRSSVTSSR